MHDDNGEEAAPQNDPPVHVRIDLGAARLEFTGRQSFFESHIAHLTDAMLGLPAAAEAPPPAAYQPDAPQVKTPTTFVPSSPQRFQTFAGQIGANAATVDQRIMAFAFYLWNYERQDDFAAEDILAFFRTVHEDPPSDIEVRVASLADTKRFLEALPEPGRWRFTTKGVNYVRNRLLGGENA